MPNPAKGDNLSDYYSMKTRGLAQLQAEAARESSASRYSSGSISRKYARQEALKGYLGKLVPAMKISSEVRHIPVEQKIVADENKPDKKWIKYYRSAKTTLRPEMKYLWHSNANRENTVIVLSKQHIDILQSNLDIIMWYRNQLDEKGVGDEHSGAQSFKIFVDYMIAGILKGLPDTPHVDMDTGLMTVPTWNLDERNLRSQIASTYRYLTAKYVTYEEFEQFGPADREFLIALMKTAYLLGARMEQGWLEELDVSLDTVTKSTAWKIPMKKAFAALGAKKDSLQPRVGETQTVAASDQQACIIPIPRPKPKAKPKPKPPVAKPKKDEVQTVEIIIRSK